MPQYLKLKTKETSGFGLIDMMMSIGISGAIALGATSILLQQRQQQALLEKKSAILESQIAIASALANPSICLAQLSILGAINLAPANTSVPYVPSTALTLPKLYLGAPPSAPVAAEAGKPLPTLQTGPQVATISVSDILKKSSTLDTQYTANIYVNFASDPKIKPDFQPMKIRLTFTTDSTHPISARNITQCNASFGSALTSTSVPAPTTSVTPMVCPGFQVMAGINTDGTPQCKLAPGTPCTSPVFGPVPGVVMTVSGVPSCCTLTYIDDSSPHVSFLGCAPI